VTVQALAKEIDIATTKYGNNVKRELIDTSIES
jgi:hypothetical protein